MPWLKSEPIDTIRDRINALLDIGTREDWDKHFPGLSQFTDVQWKIIEEAQARYIQVQRNIKLSEDNHFLVQENTRLKKALTAMGVSASIIILYLAYNLYREKNTPEESTPPRSKILDIPEPLPQGTTFAVL